MMKSNSKIQCDQKQLGNGESTQPFHITSQNCCTIPWSILLGLCATGFFISFQPSEPYLSSYLIENKHLSEAQLDAYVWPFYTYASFVFLIPVGFLAEIVGYKTIILIGLVCREATRIVLLFSQGVAWMSFMQVTYSAAIAINGIYFAFVFMVVDIKYFNLATGLIHASMHLGNFSGSLLAQALVNKTGIPMLFYMSWGFTSIGAFCFLFLPRQTRNPPDSLGRIIFKEGFKIAFNELKLLYSNIIVRYWSIWWILAFGANSIIGNYYQTMLYKLDPDGSFGLVQSAMEGFAVIGSIVSSFTLIVSPSATAGIIFLSTMLSTALLFGNLISTNILPFNIFLISYWMVFSFQLAMAGAGIANCLSDSPRYSIIFTFNSFIALGIATVLQQMGTIYNTSSNNTNLTLTYFAIGTFEQAISIMIFGIVLLKFGFRKITNRRLEAPLLGDTSQQL